MAAGALDSPRRLRHGYAHRTELLGGRMRIPRLFLSHALLLSAIGLLVPATAAAQTGAGSLTGIVSDQTGASVPGATVTATNQATNVAYTAVANDAGNYNISSVPVGMYVVKAELPGFRTATTRAIQIEAKQIVIRFQARDRRARGGHRGHGRLARPADRVCDGGRGDLGHDARCAAPQRTQHRAAVAAAAGRRDAQPELIYRRAQHRIWRPAVRERQP